MKTRTLIIALVLFAGYGSVRAGETLYLAADHKDVKELLADRNQFIMDVYEPAAADAARIMDALRDLEGAQGEYQRKSALTISRLKLATSIVYHDPSHDPSTIDARMSKFSGQYQNILAKAPMSLRNVIRIAEASLPTEVSNAGRTRMAQKFAPLLKNSGASFDVEMIDAIVNGPLIPGPRPEIQLPSRPTPQSLALTNEPAPVPPASHDTSTPAPTPPPPAVDPSNPHAPKPAQPSPPTPSNKLSPPPPPAPRQSTPPPGAPLPPAPPIEDWSGYLKQATEKFGLNPGQMEAAQAVVNQSIALGQKHRDANRAAFEAANQASDPQSRAEKLKPLQEPLNRIYNTMVRRVESIASLEQRNRAATAEKK